MYVYVLIYNWVKNRTSTVGCEPWLGFKEEIDRGAPICRAWIPYEVFVALPYNQNQSVVNIDATNIHKQVSSKKPYELVL